MITCTFENGNQNSLRHLTTGCIVVKDGQILLARRSEALLEGGKWCLVGGYVNRDETTAEAAIREAKEESGWDIGNLRLLRINDYPERPHEDRQNVDFIYIADAIKQTGEKDWESSEVQWFPLDGLPPAEQMAFDHGENIEFYKRFLKEDFPIPAIGRFEK